MHKETLPGARAGQNLEIVRFDRGGFVVSVVDAALGFRVAYTVDHDPKGLPPYTWGYTTGRGRYVVAALTEDQALEQIRALLTRSTHI